MMRRFHELRKHEEGQALVLAAISMLILTLCVLATVNLTYAVHSRIQLQNAADSIAYTAAGYEARALNYFAYTNRAMVVQYCSQMNMMADITYLMYAIFWLTALSDLTSWIPYLGTFFQIVLKIADVAFQVVYGLFAIMIPLIDIVNNFTSLVQFAVGVDMLGRVAVGPQAELNRINQTSHVRYVLDPISSTLLGLDAAMNWYKTVSTSAIPILSPPSDQENSFNRAMMTEIANGERNKWTAFGDKPAPFPEFWARHFNWNVNLVLIDFDFHKTARTEWGSFKPQGGAFSGFLSFLNGILGAVSMPEQFYSQDKFTFTMSVPLLGTILTFGVYSWARADREEIWRMPSAGMGIDGPTACPGHPYHCGWFGCWPIQNVIWHAACDAALAPVIQVLRTAILAAETQEKAAINPVVGKMPLFHFGMAPYARFRPGRQTWNRPSAKELFNQPPVLYLLTQPTRNITGAQGASLFMRSFNVSLGGLDSANSKLMAESGNYFNPPKRGWHSGTDFKPTGLGLGFIPDGFHAMAAAQAYYHRPGDWREPPNVFNPFWGAKLMPVADYPLIANLWGIFGLPAQNLVVH